MAERYREQHVGSRSHDRATRGAALSVAGEALERAVIERSVVYVTGPPGSGKSAAASAACAIAESQERTPLLVRAPSGAADASVLALAGVGRRLGEASAVSAGWEHLRTRVRERLQDEKEKVVLIIDEPSNWGAAGGLFARRTDEALNTLTGPASDWPVVVFDSNFQPGAYALPSADKGGLTDGDWDQLADAANQLATLPIVASLTTPLEQRLAAALVAWDEQPLHADAYRLSLQLAERLSNRRHGKRLWALWQRLALARAPVDNAMLSALGADGLSPSSLATLRLALLDGGGRLHDVLRVVPDERPPDPELADAQRTEAHTLLFEHHYELFRQLAVADDPAAADHAAEALFHAGELDDQTRLSLISVDLTDQLNALGHRLGTVRGDHEAAARVFGKAVLSDPHDAYAIHHLAFHRDVQGIEMEAVDAGYQHALSIEPRHPTWHARRVAFLTDCARPGAARRAWAGAESVLADDRGQPGLYGALHLPVAASLLAAGELSFCAYVLDGVPDRARDATCRALRQLLEGRLAGQDEGAFVPAPRSGREWWAEGPELLPSRDTAGRERHAWLAGRVQAVEQAELILHVVRVDKDDGPHGAGVARMSYAAFAERLLDDTDPASLTIGRFIEIGRYHAEGRESRTGIVVLPGVPVSLPIDILPADRWQP